jgi:endoglucanase Acf2
MHHIVVCILALLLLTTSFGVADQYGGYSTTPPTDIDLPPETVYRSDDFTGPMPTNDWWSSLAWEPFSSNQFPHPLACRAEEGGLRVSYPGPSLVAIPKHVIVPMQQEFVLGHSECDVFPNARIDGASDWFVDTLFAEGEHAMRVSYGHGSPFVYATFKNGGATIRFNGRPTIWSGGLDEPVLGITIHGKNYGLFGPIGSTWSANEEDILVNIVDGKSYFSLALLPDNQHETLQLYKRYAYAHIVDTRVEWEYDPATSSVTTEYAFITHAYEGEERGTLFALYPHQWKTTSVNLAPESLSYISVRGPMRLAGGSRFTTVMRFPGVLSSLPDVVQDRTRLSELLSDAAATSLSNPGDTYWHGKTLGVLAGLIPIAEQLEDAESTALLREELTSRLEDWFTTPDVDGLPDRYFFYDENWGTLIGVKPSHGSSDQLNDHHFHYGYFIRAAAEIARTDKDWASKEKWGGMIDLLIRDIASPDRDDPLFPFLRCFDPYAGHAWASGHAKFGDGNNQESSSESMNAWTGLILWGEATGNQEIRDLGIYLYTTELYAAEQYWFDVDDDLFPPEYEQTCAALVWGGKTDYATWFSAAPEHTHGIILLPIQSGSLYLGLRPEYVSRNIEGLVTLRGDDQWEHWHDTLWNYEALTDADNAMRRFSADADLLDPHARAFTYHWIEALQTLGHVDRTINADHPTAIAFTKDGRTTHVGYNMTDQPLTIRFSDGKSLDVGPGEWETSNPSE